MLKRTRTAYSSTSENWTGRTPFFQFSLAQLAFMLVHMFIYISFKRAIIFFCKCRILDFEKNLHILLNDFGRGSLKLSVLKRTRTAYSSTSENWTGRTVHSSNSPWLNCWLLNKHVLAWAVVYTSRLFVETNGSF